MDDEPIVISSGSLYTPESVATKNFATGFRGYDQNEVRAYLKRVADELSAAATREAELREAVLEAHKQAANPTLDEETLTTALGEHAAHLLTKAREAAANIVSEAEKRASRIIGEAEVRIARVRAEADGLLARRSDEADRMTTGVRQAAEVAARTLRDRARAEAEAEVESARKQGREMVGEARAVRERMLADLTRRRRTAEAQIEHLRMARLRLLEAYSVVRRTLDEATHELGVAEAEAGPVLDAAAGRLPRGDDHDDQRRASPSQGRSASGPSSRGPDQVQRRPAVAAPSARELAGAPASRAVLPTDRAPSEKNRTSSDRPSTKVETPKVEAPKVEAPAREAASKPAATGVAPPAVTTSADDLFARLRAAQAAPAPEKAPTVAPVAATSASSHSEKPADAPSLPDGNGVTAPAPASGTSGEGTPISEREESAIAWRDQLLEPIEADLTRRLRRVLQDEQNEVLDRLRRERHPTAGSVLPSLDEQVERYQAVAVPLLSRAADHGSEFLVSSGAHEGPGGPPDGGWKAEQWAADLAVDLVVPLRDRLDAAISEAVADSTDADEVAYDLSGVSERLSAAYRQCKAAQLGQAARHHASVAFAEGAFAATPPDAKRSWVVDDDGGPCPDCDDNTLAGAVTKGQPFPTGQTHPPAHGGCRCILVAPPS
ncbi:MAG: DivIVA domain-containing protein [Actinomycetota bacterium]|nr:DivIVA domain-containing protein [Actinomycetota bacterium]